MSTEHQQYSIERRTGLQQLLKDVVGGTSGYHAILVYDVSRWGRFQDTNESAHYEFLCKSAGVPVHYCAEIFANDGSLSSLIMKALKRTMAGEYSRDLGVRVFAGMKRLTLLGVQNRRCTGLRTATNACFIVRHPQARVGLWRTKEYYNGPRHPRSWSCP
jgi:DNA invertase Pin-like site-specific DNA recombinase